MFNPSDVSGPYKTCMLFAPFSNVKYKYRFYILGSGRNDESIGITVMFFFYILFCGLLSDRENASIFTCLSGLLQRMPSRRHFAGMQIPNLSSHRIKNAAKKPEENLKNQLSFVQFYNFLIVTRYTRCCAQIVLFYSDIDIWIRKLYLCTDKFE